jgi:molecular chaperone HtpG
MAEHRFQAEVGRVLSLVVNSLYSNKEIFLRELLSNASDALDKLRFRAITEPDLLKDEPVLAVRLRPDAERNVLVIEDTGVGMTEAELTENLGTIARSGSQEFLERLAEGAKKDVSIIGQFGVGFYSAYLVADRVDVVSRAAGATGAFKWTSTGKDTFTVVPFERAARGTEIHLHLKEDQKQLLDPWTLRDLVRRYSDYLAYPIELETTSKDGEAKRETINKTGALWQRPKSEITEEQYDEQYLHLTHDFDKPLARTHFRIEGNVEAVGLLFLPRHAPVDLDDPRKQRGMRLFVKRVLVMDDCDALLPQWLRFARGLVDSDDLPLNVSRELLQDSSTLRTIKKQVTKRVLDLLDELAKDRAEDYAAFWGSFGHVLKEGLVVDAEWKGRIATLVRYPSTRSQDEEARVSLDAYVEAMKEGQEGIYWVAGESRATLEGSPHIEALRARGFEVLLMTDPVDTWAIEALGEHAGKKLVNAMRADVALPASDEQKKETEEAAKDLGALLAVAKETLGDKVREVRVSSRLLESPSCLVLAPGAMPGHLEALLRRSGKEPPAGKRDLELNPKHPAVRRLGAMASGGASDELRELVTLVYEQALVAEGARIEDPAGFAKRVAKLMARALG